MMNQKENEKFAPSCIFEGITSISAVLNGCAENDRKIEKVWIDRDKRRKKGAEIAFLQAKSRELGFPVEFTDAAAIDAVCVGNTHGGMIAFCTDRTIPTLTCESIQPNGFSVYIDGIEDPYNFGYTIRSLYAAGVNSVILPERNWMTAAGVVARASAGTSERMPLYSAPDGEEAVKAFRNAGYTILCAGIRDSVSLFDKTFSLPVLLIVGGEKRGISRKILQLADQTVRIDYGRTFRGSLSAASAATVMAFEIFRQNRDK